MTVFNTSAEQDAFNAGVEAAAGLFDDRQKAATALTSKAANVTEMQLHSGASLRAQLDAKKIRALKIDENAEKSTLRDDVDLTAPARSYGS